MRIAGTMLAVLAFAGCSADTLKDVKSELRVTPRELDWPRVFVGHPLALPLHLRNTGRAPIDVVIEDDPPFVSERAVTLAGSAEVTIDVLYAPQRPGDDTGTLVLTTGTQSIDVLLSGHAETPPECTSDDSCSTSALDPEEGCVITKLPDDAPCGNECESSARCHDGMCLGAGLACDGDPCQACVPGRGCEVIDAATSCPYDVNNPCIVPVCTAGVGCAVENVPDATPCGPLECTGGNYHVCFNGVCENRTPSGGVRCGEKTPCREYGSCTEAGGTKCSQPDVHPIEPAWTFPIDSEVTLHFDGVANDSGTLYWAECTEESCFLRALTRDRFPAFHEKMFSLAGADRLGGTLALVGGSVISTLRPGFLESYSAENGDRIWSLDLNDALGADLPADRPYLAITSSPVAGNETVAVSIVAFDGPITMNPLRAWVVAVKLTNGTIKFRAPFEGELLGLTGDGRGGLYTTEARTDGVLTALADDGTVRWKASVPAAPPAGSVAGRVFHSEGGVFEATSGAPLGSLPYHLGLDDQDVLVWSGSAYSYGYPYDDLGFARFEAPTLFRVDVETMKEIWHHQLPLVNLGMRARPVLTKKGSVIVAQNDRESLCDGATMLDEWGDGTAPIMHCPLPGAGFTGTAVLLRERYVIVDICNSDGPLIASFPLEGYDAPSRGWVAPGGNPGRSGEPR